MPIKMINLLLWIILSIPQIIWSQNSTRPRLVVGVTVDQMRAEYLNRFRNNYLAEGFQKLVKNGFVVKNAHYNYIPTTTGAGHASIHTGTTPANHGIVDNYWYDRKINKMVYCAEDREVALVDLGNTYNVPSEFSRSPKNLQSNTLTDELKLFSNGRSKVIGISLKDRSAIFPAGHLADAAFWYNSENGNFVTSTYYTDSLPDWLVKFNKRKLADSLLNKKWEFLLPRENYVNSGPDGNGFEKHFVGKSNSVFPFGLKSLRKSNGDFAMITEVPHGNILLTELAKATIRGAKMGKNNSTDFLTISYSSADYVGHAFGIRSKELEDTYIRLDRDIADLLNFLDDEIGKENYLLYLTADHGASDHPIFLNELRLPGKFYDSKVIKDSLESHLSKKFDDDDYIVYVDKFQIYFEESYRGNKDVIKESVRFLTKMEGIKEVYIPSLQTSRHLGIGHFFKNAYNRDNSGDILLHFKPGWMPVREYGTSHSTAYNDDTHVPLIMYGWNIPTGETVKYHEITELAATLSFLLGIPLPNAANKNPISEVFELSKSKSRDQKIIKN